MQKTLKKLTKGVSRLHWRNTLNLAPTPTNGPRYSIEVKNAAGTMDVLGDPRATRALLLLMNQHAVTGGAACHWGGPAAMAEIMSSLHAIMFRRENWFDHYNFVNDAGHTENGIYALRANYGFGNTSIQSLWRFRSLQSPLTGHGEAHVNPKGVLISNGPLGSGLPQAQGLALAEHLNQGKRITICTISDGACMEGEAKESLSAIPGLSRRRLLGPFLLLLSNNNTKLSGRIDQDSFSLEPTFASLAPLGWNVKTLKDGNDLKKVHLAIDTTLTEVQKNPTVPHVLIFHTTKGKGVRFTEESSNGGHGHPLKPQDPRLIDFIQEVYHPDIPPSEFIQQAKELLHTPVKKSLTTSTAEIKREKIQAGISRAAVRAAKRGLPIYSVSSDLQGSTGMGAFHKAFPQYSLDVGVAEANMISTAVGLSKRGWIPIVDTFSQFGVTKGNLPLIMAGLSQAPVIAIFSHTGFQDAADGASHQATTYFSAVASIPYCRIICCSCSEEAEALLSNTIEIFHQQRQQGKIPQSAIFFMGRENFPRSYTNNPQYPWDDIQIIGEEGNHLTVAVTGSLLETALSAQTLLKENGISATVVNIPFVNSTQITSLTQCLEKTNYRLITLEDHQVIGGFGSMISHALLQSGCTFKLKSMGIPGTFGRSAYQAAHLYQSYQLTPRGILRAAETLIR